MNLTDVNRALLVTNHFMLTGSLNECLPHPVVIMIEDMHSECTYRQSGSRYRA